MPPSTTRATSRIRIPVHVVSYSLLFSPAILFGLYYQRYYHDNEVKSAELETELQAKYADDIHRVKQRNAQMAAFFQKTMQGNQMDPEVDKKLSQGMKIESMMKISLLRSE
jgi:hypothetical protein